MPEAVIRFPEGRFEGQVSGNRRISIHGGGGGVNEDTCPPGLQNIFWGLFIGFWLPLGFCALQITFFDPPKKKLTMQGWRFKKSK